MNFRAMIVWVKNYSSLFSSASASQTHHQNKWEYYARRYFNLFWWCVCSLHVVSECHSARSSLFLEPSRHHRSDPSYTQIGLEIQLRLTHDEEQSLFHLRLRSLCTLNLFSLSLSSVPMWIHENSHEARLEVSSSQIKRFTQDWIRLVLCSSIKVD